MDASLAAVALQSGGLSLSLPPASATPSSPRSSGGRTSSRSSATSTTRAPS
ncbi:hypothetical protein [Halogeometricum sp. CBA1124]|uniref:hypothetical protein n=1 Tax=Halogeometricum sp. CBA1124 TaxID=2668071 RepID=UPI001E578FD7|nr:hypothetical protein [Halogeometricum sp. CBA1124]